ncbi:MAG: ATP-binding cassette domain-containing protein [Lachnospiraceae bacterium]|nr:ATP-binding cassette domain-containing protein [Lachnospiraceae bacterium]
MTEENSIFVQDLCKHFDSFTLDHVSFRVPKGRIVGFIGENGAGKSTTINLILNDLKKDGGQIQLFGREHTASSVRENIGVVFDEEKRLAIALTDVKKDGSPGSEAMKWSENYYNIPNLSSCTDLTSIAKCPFGTDGRENTGEILACGSECGGTPAATAVNRYQPINCSQDFCKKTKWFLPSGQELLKIYDAKDRLEASLTSLSSFGAKILNGWYWSSSERDSNNAWYLTMLSGVTVTGYVLTCND